MSEQFESLFRAHYDDVRRYALRRVGPENADDVVADVFLVAWRRRETVPIGAERLWLFGVAAKVVANERRRQLRRVRLLRRIAQEPETPSTDRDDPADTPNVTEDHSAALGILAALATLPALEQEALRLTEWEQLAPSEAAQVAGCTYATFRVRLHRARRHLADLVASSATPLPQPSDERGVIA